MLTHTCTIYIIKKENQEINVSRITNAVQNMCNLLYQSVLFFSGFAPQVVRGLQLWTTAWCLQRNSFLAWLYGSVCLDCDKLENTRIENIWTCSSMFLSLQPGYTHMKNSKQVQMSGSTVVGIGSHSDLKNIWSYWSLNGKVEKLPDTSYQTSHNWLRLY